MPTIFNQSYKNCYHAENIFNEYDPILKSYALYNQKMPNPKIRKLTQSSRIRKLTWAYRELYLILITNPTQSKLVRENCTE